MEWGSKLSSCTTDNLFSSFLPTARLKEGLKTGGRGKGNHPNPRIVKKEVAFDLHRMATLLAMHKQFSTS